MEQPLKILSERKNATLETREWQLSINNLGYKGGKPYIEERLSRFPSESSVDFDGGTTNDGYKINGRKEQAYVVPYLGRIVDKINQYIFAEPPVRTNIDESLEEDITSKNESINTMMEEVSTL